MPDGESQFHRRVYRHRVGADPSTDELIFGEGSDKTAYFGVSTSRDGNWLVVSSSLGTAPRSDVYIADLRNPALTFKTIQEGEDVLTSAGVHLDGRLYVMTNRDAPRWHVCIADPANPEPENWRDLLPQTDAVIETYTLTNDAIVVVRSRHAVSYVTVHDKATGEERSTVELPGLGSAGVSSRPEGGDDVWIGYTDFVTPYRVLHYDLTTRALTTWAEPPGGIDIKGIVAEQHTYQSKDGTDIRLFLLHREDVTPNGPSGPRSSTATADSTTPCHPGTPARSRAGSRPAAST